MIELCASCTKNKHNYKLFCDGCGKVQEIKLGSKLSVFDVFELKVSLDIDRDVLDKKYSELMTLMHPDKFVNATEAEKLIAEANTATINKAYTILSSEIKIYDYILNDVNKVNTDEILEDEDDYLMEKMFLYEELGSINSSNDCRSFREKLNKLYSAKLDEVRKNIGKQSWHNAKKVLEKLKFIQNLIDSLEKKSYMLEIDEKALKK